jgi:hypothetical protein
MLACCLLSLSLLVACWFLFLLTVTVKYEYATSNQQAELGAQMVDPCNM